MRFDIENLNPGKWFDLGADDAAGVCLRCAPAAELARISKATTKKGGKTDPEAFDRALWDYCIVDWRGIEDANGESIECTTESKSALMGGAPDFAQFVAEKLAELRQTQLSERDLEKN